MATVLDRYRLSEPSIASPEALVNEWLSALYGAGKSQNTIRIYARALRDWIAFAREAGMPLEPSAVSAEHLRAFVVAMRDRGLAQNTIAIREEACRVWFAWLVEQGEVRDSPWTRIKRQRKHIPTFIIPTAEQVQAMIEAARTRHRTRAPAWVAVRDVAILAVLFDTGLRAHELLSLRRRDVSEQRVMTVTGKGRKDRAVMLSENVWTVVRRYVRAYERAREPLAPESPLWWGVRGELTVSGLDKLVRYIGEATGIDMHPHLLRHSWASAWIDGGGDRWSLKVLAGWSSDVMTARYTKTIEGARALTDHQKHSPARGLKL